METGIDEQVMLRVTNLSVCFGGLKAVNGVEFSLAKGSILGIIGPNGSGKTTLLNLLSGLLKPASGDILVRNRSIVGLRPDQVCLQGVVRSFQIPQLCSETSVIENVMLGMHTRVKSNRFVSCLGLPSARREELRLRDEALVALERVSLAGCANERAGSLPYGKKRLIDLARALMAKPEVLLLDEPTCGLSPAESTGVSDLIVSLKDAGMSVVIVEHNLPVVMRIAENLLVLNGGRRIYEGRPELAQYDPSVVEVYLGKGWDEVA